MDNLDANLIGKAMREQEKGVFVNDTYIFMSEELELLYDGNYPILLPVDHTFELRIELAPSIHTVFGTNPGEVISTELKLPISDEDFADIMHKIGATSITDCVLYDCNCIIPQFDKKFENIKDFENLNQLAVNLKYFRDNDELLIYKAMVETMDQPSLETALELCEYTGEFTLNQNSLTSTEYAQEQLKSIDIPMKSTFYDTINLNRYGNELMKNHGAETTPYGILMPNDGMLLQEKLEQAQTQSPEMTITMG